MLERSSDVRVCCFLKQRAPLEVKSLKREVTYLNELLEQLEELATEHEAGTVKGAVEILEKLGTFEDCNRMVAIVEKCVKKCQQIEGQQVRKIGKRLLWPFRQGYQRDIAPTREIEGQVECSRSSRQLKVSFPS